MNEIDVTELISIIKNDKNLDYIAFAITPWHAHGVDAGIKYLRQEKGKVNGIVLITVHPVSGYSINKDNFVEKESIDYLCFEEKERTTIQRIAVLSFLTKKMIFYKSYIRERKRVIYMIMPARILHLIIGDIERELKDVLIIPIIVDEGLATYFRFIYQIVDKKFWITLKNTLDYRLRYFVLDTLDWLYKMRKFKKKDLCLFRKQHNSLIQNDESIKLYRRVLSEYGLTSKSIDERYSNSVVINSQTFFNNGEISEQDDIDIVRNIVKICKDQNVRVLLKLHPRDTHVERFDCIEGLIIDASGKSQESILANIKEKPLAIIGITTTTLITANLFYEIPCASIGLLCSKLKIAHSMQEHIESFNDTFAENVTLLKSYEEIKLFIEQVRKKRDEFNIST